MQNPLQWLKVDFNESAIMMMKANVSRGPKSFQRAFTYILPTLHIKHVRSL